MIREGSAAEALIAEGRTKGSRGRWSESKRGIRERPSKEKRELEREEISDEKEESGSGRENRNEMASGKRL